MVILLLNSPSYLLGYHINKKAYLSDPNYHKAIELYDKSADLEEKGNVEEALSYYLQGLDLQQRVPTVPNEIDTDVLPQDIMYIVKT